MSTPTVTTSQLNNLIESGKSVELIDVRTPVEFREVHVSIARNNPLYLLDAKAIASAVAPSHVPVYVICKSGSRGRQACEKLIAAGRTNVFNVEGGTSAWEQAGLPVVRGKKSSSSIEGFITCQVRQTKYPACLRPWSAAPATTPARLHGRLANSQWLRVGPIGIRLINRIRPRLEDLGGRVEEVLK